MTNEAKSHVYSKRCRRRRRKFSAGVCFSPPATEEVMKVKPPSKNQLYPGGKQTSLPLHPWCENNSELETSSQIDSIVKCEPVCLMT